MVAVSMSAGKLTIWPLRAVRCPQWGAGRIAPTLFDTVGCAPG
jgi:hypothetical protein